MFLQQQDVFLLHKSHLPLVGGIEKLATRFFVDNIKKINGRPKSTAETKSKFINVRFTETEFKSVLEVEKALGISKTEFIRMRALSDTDKIIINSKELLHHLDHIGADIGRVGNNINQLARHANILKLQGSLNNTVAEKFNSLFVDYIQVQQELEGALRKIIRAMGK